MYTQCPNCKKKQQVKAKQLRQSQAMLTCENCLTLFNALERLHDGNVKETQANPKTPKSVAASPSQAAIIKKQNFWHIGLLASLGLLAFQIYFFMGYQITQQPRIRPFLQKTCGYFNCQLPLYNNTEEFYVMPGSFKQTSGKSYLFQTVLTNNAPFAQATPSIKLTLNDYIGQPLAERIFKPHEYLKQTQNLMTPNLSIEVSLHIAAPIAQIGGYHFQLIS